MVYLVREVLQAYSLVLHVELRLQDALMMNSLATLAASSKLGTRELVDPKFIMVKSQDSEFEFLPSYFHVV